MGYSSRIFRAALGTAALSGLLLMSAQAQTYTLTDLGSLGGSQSFATDVNNSGQVAGDFVSSTGVTQGFVSGPNGTQIHDLGTQVTYTNSFGSFTALGTSSYALGINNLGQVAGAVTGINVPNNSLGFVSTSGGAALNGLVLGNDNSYSVADINDKGQVAVGTGIGTVFYDPSVGASSIVQLPYFYGVAINNSGQIAGNNSAGEGELTGPDGGPGGSSMVALGPGIRSPLFDVNNGGQAVGSSQNVGILQSQHALLTQLSGAPSMDLGTLVKGSAADSNYAFSQAHGLNDSDLVVGTSQTSLTTGGEHAFLWQKGVMTDLNSLIAPGSGFTLLDATSISDTGYIVGSGVDAAGQTHAFLLSPIPVPEASTTVSFVLLLALGGGALAAWKPGKKVQKRG